MKNKAPRHSSLIYLICLYCNAGNTSANTCIRHVSSIFNNATTLILLTFLVINFTPLSIAQQPNLDSLNRVWLDETQPDTNRFKAMNSIAWNGYIFSKPDTTFILAQQLLDLAKIKGNIKWQAIALNIQGVSFVFRGKNEEALEHMKRSLKLHESINNKNGIASCYSNIGSIYQDLGQNKEALDYYLLCLKIYEEIGNKIGLAKTISNIGIIFSEQGRSKEALQYYQRSIKILEELGDKRGIAKTLTNFGSIYHGLGKTKEALTYFQRSLKIQEEIGDKQGIAGTLVNIGGIYESDGNRAEALNYFNRSLMLFEELEHKMGLASCLNAMATTYKNLGKNKEALEYNLRSLKIRMSIGDKSGIATSLCNIGEIYNIQENLKDGLIYAKKSMAISQEIGMPNMIRNASKLLFEIYEKQGQGMKALQMHKLYSQMNDSLKSQETVENLQQIEFDKRLVQDSMANAEKERLATEVHNEEVRKNDRTKYLLAGSGLVLLFFAGGTYSRLRYVRKSKAELQIEKDRSDNLLLNILPEEIARELKEKGKADARDFEMVSILFTDFKQFTQASEMLTATELVNEINQCFEAFDGIMEKYNVEKIKTIGDAYMAAGGLPIQSDDSAKNTIFAALEMQAFITQRKTTNEALGLTAFEMRVGIHTGPVVAGIVGVKKFQYDIWGDTVNTASRMESAGEVGKVNISQTTFELIKNEASLDFYSRGKIEAKGKGEMEMWFVTLKN